MTNSEILLLIAKSTFRPFDESDYFGFAGVESETPMIADVEGDGYIIIDGNTVEYCLALGETVPQHFQLDELYA